MTLYPGSGVQPLQGSITNNASFAQSYKKIVATIQTPTGANVGGTPACTTADFQLTNTTGWVISTSTTTNDTATRTLVSPTVLAASGGQDAFSGLNVKMIDNTLNQDSCKDATVNLQYVAS